VAAAGLAVALAIAIASGSFRKAADPVAVFPSAGTPTASPRTQVSFRGTPPAELTNIEVTGSKTGRHSGRLSPHSDGRGASFLPDRRFRSGERVTVRAAVPLTGARDGAVRFKIARPPRGGYRGSSQNDPGGTPNGAQRFRTRPDLRPPTLRVTRRTPSAAPGSLFVAAKAGEGQDGAIIADEQGRTVWFKRVPRGTSAFDFRTQEYEGKPVLTWWQGKVLRGQGLGEGLIYDSSYRRIARVRTGNGYRADFHEFQLTPSGTALMLVYQPVRWDLRSVGGPRNGVAVDTIVQEVDVRTGLVRFEWHSLGNVPLSESYEPNGTEPFDVTHVNSVEEQEDGDLLVSARNTHALYLLDRSSGRILWRLGGKKSDFKMRAGSQFIAQHTTHRMPGDTFTIFDNGAPPTPGREARGLVVKLDRDAKTVSVTHSLRHPKHLKSPSQGSLQALPNGNFLVGWGGDSPYVTEFDARNRVVFDSHFVPTGDDTYRAYRLPWTGRPADAPAVAASAAGGGALKVFASWNGATEVASWEVLSGAAPDALQPVASAPRSGFETRIPVAKADRWVAVRALGAGGQPLGTSKAIDTR
jgi:hypothetical protein